MCNVKCCKQVELNAGAVSCLPEVGPVPQLIVRYIGNKEDPRAICGPQFLLALALIGLFGEIEDVCTIQDQVLKTRNYRKSIL